jgi:hypothetical protein
VIGQSKRPHLEETTVYVISARTHPRTPNTTQGEGREGRWRRAP